MRKLSNRLAPRRRARSDEARAARRDDILDAAAHLFAEGRVRDLRMVDVARAAGLAKGTLYLYFPTKEALFLGLLDRDLGLWADALAADLAALGPATPDAVAEAIATSLVERPRLTRLLGLLHSDLEQNLAPETALDFKRALLEGTAALGAMVEQCLSLPPGEGGRVLLRAHALVVGLRQMADPPPLIADVLARPEMAPLRVDFADELRLSLAALLRGLSPR